MNCKNCGFTNKPDVQKCIKCQTDLQVTSSSESLTDKSESSSSHSGISRTLRGQQPIDEYIDNAETKVASTIRGKQPNEPYIDLPADKSQTNSDSDPLNCPHCGFQQFTNSPFCPNCKNDISKPLITENNGPKNYSGTIDPYSRKGFSLRPIINGTPGNQKLEFQGTTELNRSNTIKDNHTITSQVQAEVIYDNGEWYLLDRSEKQTTFVRPGKPIKLNKGDIILLGDTKFIFD